MVTPLVAYCPLVAYFPPRQLTPLQARAEAVDRYSASSREAFANATYAAMVESVDIALGRIRAKLGAFGIE